MLLAVGGGGFLGSVLRYLLGGVVQDWSRSATFPYGTLAVNALGCFAVGFLSYLAESRGALGAEARAFLVVGVLGGFTTFSAFANESVNLLLERERLAAVLNVSAHLILALGGVLAGRAAGALVWR